MAYIYICIYGHALRAPAKWFGKPPPLLWCGLWGLIGNPPPSFPPCGVGSGIPPSLSPCGVGSCGWESPSLFPPFVVWGLVSGNPPPFPLWCGVWWDPVRARVGSPGGREASLMRQTIFCRRRFCSETLGCPFRCFGRPWRFMLGTIQFRAIKSVLMTSRPAIIHHTLCHILYTIYSRVFTIYYRLYSVYMVSLYRIARPLKRGNQVLHTSLRAMWEPNYSILQHAIV